MSSHEPVHTRREGTPGRLDAAINRAVRQMMSAEPPAGLRHRVMARIQAPAGRTWFVPQFALGTAALAAIVLAVVIMRPGAPAAPSQGSPSAIIAEAPKPLDSSVGAPPAAAPPVAGASQTAERTIAQGPRRERLPVPPRMTDVFGPAPGRVRATSLSGAPIDDPNTPEVEPGTTFRSPISGLRPFRIEQITVEPLRIAPLSPPR
jgi:hypothetical protein